MTLEQSRAFREHLDLFTPFLSDEFLKVLDAAFMAGIALGRQGAVEELAGKLDQLEASIEVAKVKAREEGYQQGREDEREQVREHGLQINEGTCPDPHCSECEAGSPLPHGGMWEVVPAHLNNEPTNTIIGYKVRWSVPDDQGRYLWVGHYYAGENNLGWCETAAESDAKRKNDEGKRPEEYRSRT